MMPEDREKLIQKLNGQAKEARKRGEQEEYEILHGAIDHSLDRLDKERRK
jgi:hypothetical protein